MGEEESLNLKQESKLASASITVISGKANHLHVL